jgi:hypothetical protein
VADDKITELEKEIKRLKIRIESLIGLFATESDLPLLGPGRWEKFEKTLKSKELQKGL